MSGVGPILAVNAGSSSLKFSLHAWDGGPSVGPVTLRGGIEGLEPGGAPRLQWSAEPGTAAGASRSGRMTLPENPVGSPHDRALLALRELLAAALAGNPVGAVVHRVVHGGNAFRGATRVDDTVLAALRQLESLAPLHQPHNLAGIERFRAAWPGVPQIACFDTAFHADQSPLEQRFALPQALHEQGIRRYGFHGLSYQFVAQALKGRSPRAEGRLIMAHLGNGASLCGALKGRSRASTMGFSALDGLMMGTRCGALDPGVLLHLMAAGWTHERLERLLYRESGLLGVSGLSADMRRLRADGSEPARLAIDLFTHRVVRECGALAAVLEGVDAIAFTGGIGEHDAVLRAEVAQRLGWLGARLDPAANAAAVGSAICPVHAPDSRIELWVVPTDEGTVAAQEAAALLARAASA